jgi:hypothetical protein
VKREELPQQWKESTIVPIYRKGDEIDHSNYTGISLVQTICKILSYILVSRSDVGKIIGDHCYGF